MSSNNEISNPAAFEENDIVREYSNLSELQKPEETIFSQFKNDFKNMRMLDIGIGGGRTTYHLMNLVKEYVGIDYSENMINECQKRFPNLPENVSFRMCDVRDMSIFESHYFDFVLFSFNGIDYISHKDRSKALGEMKRVCKKGGFVCFSTHNLQSFGQIFKITWSGNPKNMLKGIIRFSLLRLLNKNLKKLRNEQYAIVNDGAHRFKSNTYYIKPGEQIRQLNNLGLKKIRCYSLSDGKEIVDESKLDSIKDFWLYFLSTV